MRAEGNLSYPELMQVIESVWTKLNPQPVPLYAWGISLEQVKYPCIVFNLSRRVTQEEIKPRVREEIRLPDGTIKLMKGQLFVDTVTFVIMTDGDPKTADLLAEAWEDFMLEYTGVFKRLGARELIYGRRYKADLDESWGENIVTRWIDYTVHTEKVYAEDPARFEEIALEVRARPTGDEELNATIDEDSPDLDEA